MGKKTKGWKNLSVLMHRHWIWCQYCEQARAVTMDHIFPKSLGGKYTAPNCALACHSCNNAKGSSLNFGKPKPLNIRCYEFPLVRESS